MKKYTIAILREICFRQRSQWYTAGCFPYRQQSYVLLTLYWDYIVSVNTVDKRSDSIFSDKDTGWAKKTCSLLSLA